MIIVTGAAGFIGSCLLKHLNDQKEEQIIAVDDLGTDERWKNLVGKRFIELLTLKSCLIGLRTVAQRSKA